MSESVLKFGLLAMEPRHSTFTRAPVSPPPPPPSKGLSLMGSFVGYMARLASLGFIHGDTS